MSSNNSINDPKGSKLGRKGDPRMHKAVTARLDDPNLSLYEALKIGGFNYPDNDDASQIDSEHVTLGQRKNQLSRRLRLAKKQRRESGGGGGALNSGVSSPSGESAGDMGQFNNFGLQYNQASGSNNDMPLIAAAKAPGGGVAGASTSQPKKPMKNSLGARALQMKRDGDFTLDDSDIVTADNANNNIGMMEEQAKRPRIAKFHPDFRGALIVPPASFRGASSYEPLGLSANRSNVGPPLHVQGRSQPNTGLSNLGGETGDQHSTTTAASAFNFLGPSPFAPTNMMTSNLGTGPYFNPQFTNAFSNQQANQQPRASAVAVSSLTTTAQAVGLTLEQLALALSSNTTNLAKLVAETKSGESMAKQQDLALNLFETESKALYTKCMLMAGIDVSLAQPDTPTYMAFALKAWQAEGNRLQKMMSAAKRDNDIMEPSDISVLGETGTITKEGTNDEDDDVADDDDDDDDSHEGHGHNHTHEHAQKSDNTEKNNGHDSSNCDAQHLHRLGSCGHKAIIHQPKNGAPHIDFIVNDQVECYMGLESVPFGKNVDSAWPSKYKCKEVKDSSAKACGKSCATDVSESGVSEPKILKLSEINLHDPEWNFDAVDSVDGGVMGLFKLGGEGFT